MIVYMYIYASSTIHSWLKATGYCLVRNRGKFFIFKIAFPYIKSLI